MIPSKICKKCGVMQYILEFKMCDKTYYGNVCFDCVHKQNKEYFEKNKEKINEKKKIYKQNNKNKLKEQNKKYNENNKEKKKKYTENNKEKRKEYLKNNKEKFAKKRKEYNEKNKDKIKKITEEYNEKNKDKIRELKKEYNKKNKDNINKYAREKRKNDPNYRIKKNVSRSINIFLNKKNLNKNNKSCLKSLSYNIVELMQHIERQFEPWMNWSNQGRYIFAEWDDNDPTTWKWQLDHIIPHSTFEYDSMDHPDFQKCWALENLRPYSAKLNVLEKDRNMNKKKK